jgi:ribosomal-protein-alanine acetyltransferase
MSCPEVGSSLRNPFSMIRLRPLEPWDVQRIKELEMSWPLLSHWEIEVYHRVASGRETALGMVAVQHTPEQAERIVGFIVYRTIHPDTEILNIAVEPGRIRRQIGTQLLHEVKRLVVQQGGKNLYLEVRPSNASAREFYLKEGFSEVGRRKDYYANPTEDALLMQLQLL